MDIAQFFASQYTPQHMTEEEQLQEAIRLSLGGESDSHEVVNDEYEKFVLGSFVDCSNSEPVDPHEDGLPDPDVIQSAIETAKQGTLLSGISDLDSVSKMLYTNFGVNFEEEIDCDGDDEEEIEKEDRDDNLHDIRKEGCCLEFSGRNVHYTTAYAREVDTSKIVTGPPEFILYGHHLGEYSRPLNKTLFELERKNKLTAEERKFFQLLHLHCFAKNLPGALSSLGCSYNVETSQITTVRRSLMTPPPVRADSIGVNGTSDSCATTLPVKQTDELQMDTKRDCSDKTGQQGPPKKLFLSNSDIEPGSVKRKHPSVTDGQVDQESVSSQLKASGDNEHLDIDQDNLQPCHKKIRLIEIDTSSTTEKCNEIEGSTPIVNFTDNQVVESRSNQSSYSESLMDFVLTKVKKKEKQSINRNESAKKYVKLTTLHSNTLAHSYSRLNTDNQLSEGKGKTFAKATKPTISVRRDLQDPAICAQPTHEESIKNGCGQGMKVSSSLGKPTMSTLRADLESLINKKITIGLRLPSKKKLYKFPGKLVKTPNRITHWNKRLQSVKFYSQPQALSVDSPAVILYSPYHLKLVNKKHLMESDESCDTSMIDDSEECEAGDPGEEFILPDDNMDTHSSSLEVPTGNDEMEAGPSGCINYGLREDDIVPDDPLAVFNSNSFLLQYYDIPLKWWVINVTKNYIFSKLTADTPASPFGKGLISPAFLKVMLECSTVQIKVDVITDSIKKAEKMFKETLEASTQSILLKDADDLKSSEVVKNILKYSADLYGSPLGKEYIYHDVSPITQHRRGTRSPSDDRMLARSSSPDSANCSEEIHLLNILVDQPGSSEGKMLNFAVFTPTYLRRPVSCSVDDSTATGQLTSSGINLDFEQLVITSDKPHSPDSALEESRGSIGDEDSSSLSGDSDSCPSDDLAWSPRSNTMKSIKRLHRQTKLKKRDNSLANEEALDANKNDPLKNEKNSDLDHPDKETPIESDYSKLSNKDEHPLGITNTVSGSEKYGVDSEQSSKPLVSTSTNTGIAGEIVENVNGYTSDTSAESKSPQRTESYRSSSKVTSSGSESSSDEESTLSPSSIESSRRSSFGYHSQSSDSFLNDSHVGEDELVSVWSSHVGNASLYKNCAEAQVFAGPFTLLKYFEFSYFGNTVIMDSLSPNVVASMHDQEQRYTIYRDHPSESKTTSPEALSLSEMERLAATLGCFHALGMAYQTLGRRSFMVRFMDSMRTGLRPEEDFNKAASEGLTNFIKRHYNDESKRPFLDYLRTEFGNNPAVLLEQFLTPINNDDLKFWTLVVGDLTPRNIIVQRSKQISKTTVLRWNKSRIGNCFLDVVSLLVTLPVPCFKEAQILATLVSYCLALNSTLGRFNLGCFMHYHLIIGSLKRAAALLVYQFMAEEDTYRGPAEQEKLYSMVWNAALIATTHEVTTDCPWMK